MEVFVMIKKVAKRINNSPRTEFVLSDIFDTLRFRGTIFFSSALASPWGMELPSINKPRFHILLKGTCHIGLNLEEQPLKLQHMEIALLPHGEKHWIADKPGRKLIKSEQAARACELDSPLFQMGEITEKVICGLIDYEKNSSHPVIESLPSILHFRSIHENDPIWKTVILLNLELDKGKTFKSTIVDRLSEVLFMQLLTNFVDSSEQSFGFFAALNDQKILNALELIHKTPDFQWTLQILAERINMSRASMIRMFENNLGVSPMAYLKNWRMSKAVYYLKQTNQSVKEIATLVGYSTARTLSKAFHRHFSKTPSEYRRSQSDCEH